MSNPLLNILKSKGADLLNAGSKLIDTVVTNKEERETLKLQWEQEANRHLEAIMNDATKQQELENADRSSAREMNAKIQESDKGSWLSKNVAYILDISITTAFFTLIAMIAYKVVPEENKELFYMVVGILGAKWGDVVAFHRGSSKGSEEKQKSIDRMNRK